MELLADLGSVGHGRDDLWSQVLWMRTGKADAADPFDRADPPEQVSEQRSAAGDVTPVGVHILPEQRDFAHPAVRQGFDLAHDVVDRAADLGTTHGRHNAKCARVVTAHLDIDPHGIGEPADRSRRHQVIGDRLWIGHVENLDDLAFGGGPSQQIGGTAQIVGPKDHVDPSDLLLNELAIFLGQAAANGDLHIGPGVDEGLEGPSVP